MIYSNFVLSVKLAQRLCGSRCLHGDLMGSVLTFWAARPRGAAPNTDGLGRNNGKNTTIRVWDVTNPIYDIENAKTNNNCWTKRQNKKWSNYDLNIVSYFLSSFFSQHSCLLVDLPKISSSLPSPMSTKYVHSNSGRTNKWRADRWGSD